MAEQRAENTRCSFKTAAPRLGNPIDFVDKPDPFRARTVFLSQTAIYYMRGDACPRSVDSRAAGPNQRRVERGCRSCLTFTSFSSCIVRSAASPALWNSAISSRFAFSSCSTFSVGRRDGNRVPKRLSEKKKNVPLQGMTVLTLCSCADHTSMGMGFHELTRS